MTEATTPPTTPPSVLIVDEDETIVKTLRLQLEDKGWAVLTAGGADDALALYREQPTHVVMMSVSDADGERLNLARTLRQHMPDTVVLLMTGYAELETALAELPGGAHDVLMRPVRMLQFEASVRRAHRELALTRENQALKQTVQDLRASIEQGSAAAGEEPRSAEVDDPVGEGGQVPGAAGSEQALALTGGARPIASYEQQMILKTPGAAGMPSEGAEKLSDENGETARSSGD